MANPWGYGPSSLGELIRFLIAKYGVPCGLVLYAAVAGVFLFALIRSKKVARIGLYAGLAYLGSALGLFLLSGILDNPQLPPAAGIMAILGAPFCLVGIVGGWIRLQFAGTGRITNTE